jgi:hypothetical protein
VPYITAAEYHIHFCAVQAVSAQAGMREVQRVVCLCASHHKNGCLLGASHFVNFCAVQAESAQAGMKELQAQQASYQKDAGKLRGGMAAAATAVEAVRSSRHGLMEAAMLEQVGGVWCFLFRVLADGSRNALMVRACCMLLLVKCHVGGLPARPYGGGNAGAGAASCSSALL